MSGNGNGNEKTRSFTKRPMTKAERFRRKARGVDFTRNISVLAKKLDIASIRQEEKIGITVEGEGGRFYPWDEFAVRIIAYMEKLICEAEKK